MEELEYNDPNYTQILFSFFKDGLAGLECYFVQNRLYYRIIKGKYSLEKDSKSVFISEFNPEEWYYMALVHEKKFLGGSTVKVVVNGKQVVSASLEFPPLNKITGFDRA